MYKLVENFLSDKECKDILDFSLKTLEVRESKIGKNEGEVNLKIRDSKISFYEYDAFFPFIKKRIMGELGHFSQIKGHSVKFNEKFQFTEYKKNQYYNWHTDNSGISINDRYYSLSIQLNDDYIGGKLELSNDGNIIEMRRGSGNMFIFLSDVLHRVTPVTEGVRYSLVNWFGIEKEDHKKTII